MVMRQHFLMSKLDWAIFLFLIWWQVCLPYCSYFPNVSILDLRRILFRKAMFNYAWPLYLYWLGWYCQRNIFKSNFEVFNPRRQWIYELGVFGAFYKLSMIMTLFVQAFRFAAEPFFFSQHKNENAQVFYARIMDYFVMVCSFIFVFTMLFVDELVPLLIRNQSYFKRRWNQNCPDSVNG